jgi:hypothetical protein
VDREELLKEVTDKSYDYCESMGVSRGKCRRFAHRTAKTLQQAPMEYLVEFVDEIKAW